MTTLDLSSHKRSQGITVTGCSALTSLSVPNTVICGNSGFLAGSCTNLVTLTLGTVGVTQAILGPVTATTCKLNQATVDGILTLLVSLDGTGGTTLYPTSQVVNLSGGTSAAPTFTGTTVNPPVGATFVGVTTTCTVSWTGHGYSTGDLLTVAGLLTLTNANGTFQITVQNANQFTYTIVSQTGTATGVTGATVKKAGNTTEGFYEKQRLIVRGNTVTTN